jgi:hypothetical protein
MLSFEPKHFLNQQRQRFFVVKKKSVTLLRTDTIHASFIIAW